MAKIQELGTWIDPPDMIFNGLSENIQTFLEVNSAQELFDVGYEHANNKIIEIKRILHKPNLFSILQR